MGVALHVPLTGADAPLLEAEESPDANEEAGLPEGPVELVEDGGKGLEEVNPVPKGIELELISVGAAIELGLTPVSKGTEEEKLTPVGRKMEPELIPDGRAEKLELTPVPEGMEGDELIPVGGKIEPELTLVGGVAELGPTPVPKGAEGDVTPVGGKIVLDLIPVPRGIEPEKLTPVPRGAEELPVLGNGGRTLLSPVSNSTELEGVIVTPVSGPVDSLVTTLLAFGTVVMLPGVGYGALVGIAGGAKDGEGEATHS